MTQPKVAHEKLKQTAMGYPGAEYAVILGDHEVVRVRDKVFIWLGDDDGSCAVGLRLPESQHAAMMLPCVEPMGYGMAKWGWVNVTFKKGEDVPLEMLLKWLRESYRTVAPKKLVKMLEGEAPAAPASKAKRARPKARPAARR